MFRRAYFKIYRFVAKTRLEKQDLDERAMHSHLISLLGTSVLIWCHSFLMLTFTDYLPLIQFSFACATLYTLSIFTFRFTNDIMIAAHLMFIPGIACVAVVCYLTGGFMSDSLVWLAAGPMLAGVNAGKKAGICWTIISSKIALFLLVLHLSGHQFPMVISEDGRLYSQIILIIGWIGMGSITSIHYTISREKHMHLLNEQMEKTDALFRVLFHDLANSIGRVAIGTALARKQDSPASTEKGIKIAQEAATSMLDITKNVRNMYAASKGKSHVTCSLISLNESVEYVKKIFQMDLERKHLEIIYDFKQNQNLCLWVDAVSFKNQVLANIVSNAIKFSPDNGKIVIRASPSAQGFFAIDIIDEGVGMPDSLVESLFDLNKKTTRPGTHGEEGTGFGMHIMKSFVEIYEGQIEVKSKTKSHDKDSSGTTFKLILKGEWI